jgi:GT2 family glycosyltransferase
MPAPVAVPPAPAQAERRWPSVSVVVVNYNGRDYLDRCLTSLRELDYPADQVEVVLIDNASSDGSVEHVRSAFPEVRVIVNDDNVGFSPAVNQAAELASGAFIALLNNDAAADPAWLRTAVPVLEAEPSVACVASKILREDGETVDYAGGQLAFYGHGFAKGVEQADADDDRIRDTLFASGGAMIVRRSIFLEVGGFDDSYFAFFEDVDFGWRLWILGYTVRYVPASQVLHRHHGTIERFGYARERYLLERNALATVFKNYADDRLSKILPASLLLTVFRGLDVDGLELPDFTIREGAEPIGDLTMPGLTAAHLAALRDFALSLDDLRAKRTLIQDRRVRTDRVVMKLFEESLRPNVFREDFIEAFSQALRAFDLTDHARSRSSVLIITQDHIGAKMAGPAIRCWEMARLLAHEHEVTLASTQPVELPATDEAFRLVQIHDGVVDELLAGAEVVIFQGFVMHQFPQIEASDLPVLVDVYDPFHLEGLNLRKEEAPAERYATAKSDTEVLNRQFLRADFLVCASEKQRDFWLGQLASIGRVNPATFDADESLRSLLDIAPFGLPQEPPVKREAVLKGVVDGIAEDDFLLLWGGGIYNWFDPLTLIRAVEQVVTEHDDVKLFFMGAAHPNPAVPKMRMASAAYRLAEDRGLLGKHVFFNEGWVDYDRRADYLLEADLGVSTHFEHIETAFSFRTRILDYLWASLPIVATEGDSLSRLIHEHDLGLTVPPEDVDALATAIKRLRNDRDLYKTSKANVEALAPEMTWDRALAPIAEFVRQPRRAPDATGQAASYIARRDLVVTRSPVYYAGRFVEYARTVGPRTALIHARNFVRQRTGR